MRGQWMLYVDQYGTKWGARTISELRRKIGGGRVSKMYVDTKAGVTKHVGYIVGRLWCTAYVPFEGAA